MNKNRITINKSFSIKNQIIQRFKSLLNALDFNNQQYKMRQIFHFLASFSPSVWTGAFLAASLSFSSLISLNFLMFSKKSGPLCKVMKSFAFLLSPLVPFTVMVFVLISLNVAQLFLYYRFCIRINKEKFLRRVKYQISNKSCLFCKLKNLT